MPKVIAVAALVIASTLVAVAQTPSPVAQSDAPKSAPALQRGVLVERIAAANDPSQTYALYLPTSYDPAKKHPVLLIFDPGARGAVAAKIFQNAAERFGWVVIASNNSRNHAPEQHKAAVNALWPEIHERYPTDQKRIYLAGFSGGARRSMAVAAAPECKGCVAGVIACGAGAFALPGYAPTKTATFLAAGLYDFNYPELFETEKELTKAGAPHRFTVFEGTHEWLPRELAESALEWLQVRAMAEGRAPADAQFIATRFDRDVATAAALEREDAYAALGLYRAIVDDYTNLRDVAAAREAVVRLEGSREVEKARKAAEAQIRKGNQFMAPAEEILARLDKAEPADRRAMVQRLALISEELRKKRERNPQREELVPLRRAMGTLLATGYEEGQAEIKRGNHELAADLLEGVAPLSRDEYGRKYLAARAAALRSDHKKAIKLLREALAAGLPEPATLADDEAFAKLRSNPEFVALVAQIKTRQ